MTTAKPAGSRVIAGRYQLGPLIGRGGMAVVHTATDSRLDREVAVKLLRSDFVADSMVLHRFRREARAAARLNHPQIVAVYDSGEDTPSAESDGHPVPFIVMERVEGRTVREILRSKEQVTTHLPGDVDDPTQVMDVLTDDAADDDTDGRSGLDIGEAVKLTAGVLTALEYSHEKGIVHRDIKPGNVMVTDAGDIKVMDFGIAQALSDTGATQTATDSVTGTAQYLSPEQAQGLTVDERTDLYSTGCLLYEVLTGRTPFIGDTPVSIAYQHVRETAQPPSVLNPNITKALDRVVLKALAKDPEQRYPNANDFRKDLLRASAGRRVKAPRTSKYDPAPGEPTVGTVPLGMSTDTEEEIYDSEAAAAAAPTSGENMLPPLPHSKRRRVTGIVSIIIVAAVILGGVILGAQFLLGGSPGSPIGSSGIVTVPSVEGRSVDEAGELATNAGLDVTTTEQKHSDAAPGTVLAVSPAVGQNVERGTVLKLVVSKGPVLLKVPMLAGYAEEPAKRVLADAGFENVDIERVHEAKRPKGTVAGIDPPPGSSVAPGDTVVLKVSSGKVELPELTGKSLMDARRALLDLNLEPRVVYQVDPDSASGAVIGQEPKAGRVEQYTHVKLVIARAPTKPPKTRTPKPTATPTPTTTEQTPPPPPSPTATVTIPGPPTSSAAPTM